MSQDKEIEEIRSIEELHDDGIMKTKVTVNTLNGKSYSIISAVPRRVLAETLMKRVKNNVPLMFPIPSNDGSKVMDFVIPATLVQDISVEDHSNLAITTPRLRPPIRQ